MYCMKFERVDEKTVRCFISNEELEGFQIDYKDFVTRSEKAREIVRGIIEQATEEVGYKPPKFAFDMSIMMLPDQGVVLTFSENDPLEDKNGNRLMEYLKEMKHALEQAGAQKGQETKPAQDKSGQKPELPAQPTQGIFEFDSITAVMELAEVVPAGVRVHSALYRMGEKYYLYLHKGTASMQRYSKVCIQAMEFSVLYGADAEKLIVLKEHGECLIADHALKKLSAGRSSKAAKKDC